MVNGSLVHTYLAQYDMRSITSKKVAFTGKVVLSVKMERVKYYGILLSTTRSYIISYLVR